MITGAEMHGFGATGAGPDGQVPVFWREFLSLISVAKAGVGGAGLAVAILGILNLAAGIIAGLEAKHWSAGAQFDYVAYFGLAGAIVGVLSGSFAILRNRQF